MAGLNQIYRGAENKAICGKLGRASKTFVGNEKKKTVQRSRVVFLHLLPLSALLFRPPRTTLAAAASAATMHKTAQAWFTGGTAASSAAASESQPSLLADWNSYAAARSDASSSSSPLSFDIEAAVRSANDTVSGTFSS